VNGNGDWVFYGHCNAAQIGPDAWWMIDLRAFRAGLIRHTANADGTRFKLHYVMLFPAEPPLVEARSGKGGPMEALQRKRRYHATEGLLAAGGLIESTNDHTCLTQP